MKAAAMADVKADPMASILRLRAHLNPDGAGDDIDWKRLEWWAVPARRAAGKAARNDQPPARAMAGGIGDGVLTDNPPATRAYKKEGLTS